MKKDTHLVPSEPSERTYILEDSSKAPIKQLIIEDGDEDIGNMKQDHKSSFIAVTFNFVNSIIGSGIIGIPFIFREAGILAGMIIMLFIAFVGDFSLVLIIRAGHKSSRTSYQGVMEAAFGKFGYVLLSIIQFAFPFIAMISYNVIVGDTITRVVSRLIGYDIMWSRDVVTLVTSITLTFPLSLYRNIGKLSRASFVSFIFILFIIASVLARLPYYRSIVPRYTEDWTLVNSSGILTAISIATFAFVCHHNTFFLYDSLRDAELTRWRRVTHASVGISLLTMTAMGLSGYATFTSSVQGDLLNNYCWTDDLMNVCRILFTFTILLTYPLECFACREVIKMSIWRHGQLETMEPKKALFYHVAVTAVVVAATFLLSTLTDCLGIVLELNGLLAAIPLAFILPAVCYLKLEEGSIFSAQKIGSLGLAVFGFGATAIGIVSLIIQGIDNCDVDDAVGYCTDALPILNATDIF